MRPLSRAAAVVPSAMAQETPKELGDVEWARKLQPVLDMAAQTERPVLLLFQEIPG